ncbi:MAG: nuclear transport factor 2 family protein [Pseudomonadota bacterium]
MPNRKDQIRALLKSIETGDPGPIAVVNQERYIQHNPQTHKGSEGLEVLFERLSKTSPRVNVVRAFEDGDFVFGHTEYDFSRSNIGFEVFRFDGDRVVEHWDNIQQRQGPNPSGRTMVDGVIESTDRELTETNREIARAFVDEVLVHRQLDTLESYVNDGCLIQHDPHLADGAEALRAALETRSETGFAIQYDRIHRVLAEGSFVLTVSEGFRNGVHTSFYNLVRIEDGKVVEHWNTVEAIPPRSAWKNDNGKF